MPDSGFKKNCCSRVTGQPPMIYVILQLRHIAHSSMVHMYLNTCPDLTESSSATLNQTWLHQATVFVWHWWTKMQIRTPLDAPHTTQWLLDYVASCSTPWDSFELLPLSFVQTLVLRFPAQGKDHLQGSHQRNSGWLENRQENVQ